MVRLDIFQKLHHALRILDDVVGRVLSKLQEIFKSWAPFEELCPFPYGHYAIGLMGPGPAALHVLQVFLQLLDRLFPFSPFGLLSWALALSDKKWALLGIGLSRAVNPVNRVDIGEALPNLLLRAMKVSRREWVVMAEYRNPDAIDLD